MSSWSDQASAFFARSAAIRFLGRMYRERLTGAGKILLIGTAWALILGTDYDSPIYYLWCGGLGVLVVAALAGLVMGRVRVEAERRLPRHVCAGEKITYEVRVRNVSRFTARDLEIEELGLPPELRAAPEDLAVLPGIAARGEAVVRLALTCLKRGVYPLKQLAVCSSFPFGLVRTVCRPNAENNFLVYPSFRRLSDFKLPAPRRYQPGGLSMTSDVGDSTEFMSTREYRYGDNPRDIHWVSFARTGKPVVKEYQEEYFVRLALLVDSLVPEGADDRAFETGISLAASVADVLSRKEYIIDIFAAGDEIYRFQAGRALAHFDNILEILACLKHAPRVNVAAVENALRPETSRISALVCILMDWDEDRRRLIESLRALGLSVRAIVIREQEPTLAITGVPNVVWQRPAAVMESVA